MRAWAPWQPGTRVVAGTFPLDTAWCHRGPPHPDDATILTPHPGPLMQLRIFTLRFDPILEGFDDAPVTGFLADKEVLDIEDHFFVKDDVPYLALVVRYRMPALPPAANKPKAESRHDNRWTAFQII